jgi:hypothetical protein
MNARRKFLQGFGIAGAVAVGMVTATKVQFENNFDINPEIMKELEESNMSGCVTICSNYNGIRPEASLKVGRDGIMYIKENDQWRKV